jgi:hypothetical protein
LILKTFEHSTTLAFSLCFPNGIVVQELAVKF